MKKKNRRWLGKTKQMLVSSGLFLCVLGGAAFSRPCHAQTLVKPEVVLPKGYPDGFHDYGRMDAIGQDFVVIDDIGYKLSLDVILNTPKIANASVAFFRPGALVGVLKNARNEIVSLWLIE